MGKGPLSGIKIIEMTGIGAGALLRHAVIRYGRGSAAY